MNNPTLSLKKLFAVAILLLSGLAINAQVIVVATAGNPGPVPYPDLNSAFAAINAGTHQGVIGVAIGGNTVETGPCVLNSSGAGAAVYTSVTISPTVDGVSISGPTTTGRGLIELNGADNVIIDGDNPNTPGTNRNLTINNTAAASTTYTMGIRIAAFASVITSADNNIIRNCIINGSAAGLNASGNTSTSSSVNVSYGIYAGATGSSAPATNTTPPSAISSTSTTLGSGGTLTNLVIDNNAVNKCGRAIMIQGSSATVAVGLMITNNTIGNATTGNIDNVYSYGIGAQGSSNGIIRGNTILNVESYLASSIRGIDVGGISSVAGDNFTIDKNIVSNVVSKNTSGYAAYGINVAGGTGSVISNNFIYGINAVQNNSATGTTFGVRGIRIASGTNNKVYYNSIALSGAMLGSSTDVSAGVTVTSTSLTGTVIQNNIISNRMTGSAASVMLCVQLPSGGTSAMNLTMNNNVYYSNTAAANQYILGTTSSVFYTAANFNPAAVTPANNSRSYTSTLSAAGTNDNVSLASTVTAPFVSATDLHINNAAVNATDLDTKAAVVTVTDDIDSAVRDAATPDIGADEFIIPNCSAANGGTITPSTVTTCDGSTVSMTSTGASTGTGITYQWMVSTASGGPYSNVTGGSGATTVSYTTGTLTAGVYYYVLQTTCTFGPLTGLSNEVTVTVNPSPTVTVTPTTATYCSGGPAIALTASGATTYSWGPAAGLSATTGASVNASPAATTTYTVTGTASGCSSTATTTITFAETPAVTSVSATPSNVCSGGNSQLNVTGGTTSAYTLSNPAFSSTGCQANPGPAGDDVVQGNNAIGFSFNYFGVTYTQFAISTNGNIQLGDGSGNATNPSYSNAWTDVAIPNTSNPNNMIALAWDDWFISAGEITWGVTGTAPNRSLVVCFNTTGRGTGSADTLNGQIVLDETTNLIHINMIKKGIQPANTSTQGIENQNGTAGVPVPGRQNSAWNTNNNSQVFSPSGGTLTYAWTPATFLNSTTISNPMATGITSTTTYTATLTESSGCAATGTVTITAGSVLNSSASITPGNAVCEGTNITLNAVPTGGGAPYTYAWTGPNGFNSTSQNPVINNVSATEAGTYSVTVTDACTTTSLATTTLTVNPNPVVSVTPSSATYCTPGTPVALAASGATSYTWGPSAGLSATTGANVNASPVASTTYTVTGTDGNGCTGTATTTITVTETPSLISVTATPATICSGSNSQLLAAAATTTSYTVTNIPFAAIPTPGTGVTTLCNGGIQTTPMTNASLDDGDWEDQPLPFPVNFFGVTYNAFTVSTNGFIYLGSGAPTTYTGYGNTFPTTFSAHPCIGALYGDLDFRTMGTINYFVNGTAPNRQFVLNFGGGQFYNGSGSLTTQVIIYETSNVVEIHTANSTSHSGVEGIQNAAGTTAYTVTGRNNQTFSVSAPDAYRFAPNGSPLTYSWTPSTFLSSTTISNPMANSATATTTYTVTASNGGCPVTGNVTLTVNPLPTVTASASPTTICAGSSSTLTASGASTYNWMPGSLTGSPVTDLPATTTTYTVTGTDGNGCSDTATTTVTVIPSPTVTVTASSSAICTGSSVTLTATGADTYDWMPGSFTGSSVTDSPTTTTTYTVTGTITATGCTSIQTVTVTVNPLPVVALGNDTTICGSAITLDAQNAGSTYLWSDNSTAQTLTAVTTGTYGVTVTDVNGCTASDAINVTINTPPVVALGSDITQCGGTITLDAGNAGATYLWNDNSTNQTLTVSVSGTYDVTATDANGCSASDTIAVTINPVPLVDLGPDVSQCSGTVTLDAGNPGETFLWSDNSTAQTLTAGTTGIYWVDVTNSSGCTTRDSISVIINSNPVVALGNDTIMCGGSITLDAGNAGATYLWSDNSTNQTLIASASGTYYVTATLTGGCTASDTIVVTINTVPVVNLGADVTQCGGSVTLNAQNAGSTYLWSDNSTNQTLVVSSTGFYYVDVTSPAGCTGNDSINVTINTPPTVTFTVADTVCDNGGFVTLTGTPAGGTFFGVGVSGSTFDPTVPGPGSTTLTYSYTDVNGCTASVNQAVFVDDCSGINEPVNATSLVVYPNPSNGQFTIVIKQMNGEGVLEITDALGQLISSENIAPVNGVITKEINLGIYSSGMYFVRFTTNATTTVQKVNVQR